MSEQNNTQKLVNGIFCEYAVNFLRERKGESEVKELEKLQGSLMFDTYRMYPLETLNKLQSDVIKLVYGQLSNEGYYELGRFTFDAFTHTLIGATLTNIATPVEMITKIQELWNSVVNFGMRKVIEKDEINGRAVIEIQDDPRNPSYIQAIIESALHSIHTTPSTKIIPISSDKYNIEISWKS